MDWYSRDTLGFNRLMYFVWNEDKDLPENVIIKPEVRDKRGRTAAMIYIFRWSKLPRDFLMHDPDIIDNGRKNIAMYAIRFAIGVLPDWMIPKNLYCECFFGTLPLLWIRYRKISPIPDFIKINPNHRSMYGELMAQYWMKYQKSEPPEWMRCSPDLVDDRSGTMACAFIKNIEGDNPIPAYMEHDPTIVAHPEFGTAAMFWIFHKKSEPPEWMRHAADLIAVGNTMATIWIQIVKTKPPEWMLHAVDLVVSGRTMAIAWIQEVRTEPPECIRHDKSLIVNGKTIATTYIAFVKEEPSEWMRHDNSIITVYGTMATGYIKHIRKEPPEYMRHAPELDTCYGTMATAFILRYSYAKPRPYMLHSPELVTSEGTMGMAYVRSNHSNPPKDMHHYYGIKDKNGNTIEYYWRYNRKEMPKWMKKNEPGELVVGCEHIKDLSKITKEDLIVCDNCSSEGDEPIINASICGICMDSFRKWQEILVYRPCRHICCKECAKEWYEHDKTCPYCKSHITNFEEKKISF
jgi:hypothetical protein